MAKGDKVEILLLAGDKVERITVEARKNGERIVIDRPRGQSTMDVILENKNGVNRRRVTVNNTSVLAINELPIG